MPWAVGEREIYIYIYIYLYTRLAVGGGCEFFGAKIRTKADAVSGDCLTSRHPQTFFNFLRFPFAACSAVRQRRTPRRLSGVYCFAEGARRALEHLSWVPDSRMTRTTSNVTRHDEIQRCKGFFFPRSVLRSLSLESSAAKLRICLDFALTYL